MRSLFSLVVGCVLFAGVPMSGSDSRLIAGLGRVFVTVGMIGLLVIFVGGFGGMMESIYGD